MIACTGLYGGQHNKNGYILGFRIDPLERLKATVKEIQNLYQVSACLCLELVTMSAAAPLQVFSFHPIYGVQYEMESEVGTSCTPSL